MISLKEMTVQLGILGSLKSEEPWPEEHTIKAEEPWTEESVNPYSFGKEDFQQIMSDWQQHIGSLQVNYLTSDFREKFFL